MESGHAKDELSRPREGRTDRVRFSLLSPKANEVQSPLADYRRWVIEAWAVHAAVTAGLFEALRTPCTIDVLASQEHYEVSALRALLRGLVACGHVRVDESGICSLGESAKQFFLRGSDSYIGDALSFLRTTRMYESYPRILKEGGSAGLDGEQWSYVTRGSAMYARAGIETLARLYPTLMRRKGLRVLDVGCGQGAYLAELVRLLPDLQAVGIDPTRRVVEDARANLARTAPRVRVEEGTLSDVSETFDVVLINQIFHVVGVPESRALLRQAKDKLVPGGYVFVQEIVTREDDPASALFGFNMRLLFEQGTVLGLDEMTTMVADCGFEDVSAHGIEGPTPGLVYVAGKAPATAGGHSQ
jgi:SAM-dependent methyltransferase